MQTEKETNIDVDNRIACIRHSTTIKDQCGYCFEGNIHTGLSLVPS